MIVTFCGHSQVSNTMKVNKWLYTTIESTIQMGATRFYLGGYGEFDKMAAVAVTTLKKKYPHIQRVLVIPYLTRKWDMSLYDVSYYPSLETVPPRYAIVKRNEKMVQEADVVIALVQHSWGGAAKTLAYAKRKKKTIFQYESIEK